MSEDAPWSLDALLAVVARHWGYRTLRPLQEQAMRAVLDGRDSLVVLPTGGGKSLCYQAPAAYRGETTVVVSPLISLMKDQVDSLRACGIPAVQIDSSLSPQERQNNEVALVAGAVRLVFASPERLVLTDFYRLLQRAGVRTFAIDEAHCISHWGHDFRPEYRQMSRLREAFPNASVHAYTATATQQVREDICRQLGLRNPEVLVGSFDRPNLTYRVLPRRDLLRQVLEVVGRHPNEGGIVYCVRRADVDELTERLKGQNIAALPYHAGLTPEQRQRTQEAFRTEECDVVVATVAFGMGIDRPNVRFVLHAAMPKSIEHYQQETGRAGRDGLEAECVLLYSGQDFRLWKSIVEKSAEEAQADPAFVASAVRHLDDMDRYVRGASCRHRALVEYFGQSLEAAVCGACDLCLGDTQEVDDALVVAQKILSCVARVKERFGIGHVIDILRGNGTEKVLKFGHQQLSTFGLLRDKAQTDLRDWVYQLVSQGVLAQEDLLLSSGVRVPLLKLNDASWEVMRGQRSVRLVALARRKRGEKAATAAVEEVSWEGVDRELFEALRRLRRRLAEQRGVPPYVIFHDAVLRQLASSKPSTLHQMARIPRIGEVKLREYGPTFLEAIRDHAGSASPAPPTAPAARAAPKGAAAVRQTERREAFEYFMDRLPVSAVMQRTKWGSAKVIAYLSEFIREHRPGTLEPWVAPQLYERIAMAARAAGTERLQPIQAALGEQVSYDDIRLVVSHMLALEE